MQLMKHLTADEFTAISKYGRRGFRIQSTYLWPRPGSDPSLMLDIHRDLNDQHTWRLPLDTTGVSPRPQLTPTSEVMKEDPVVHNSWSLVLSTDTSLVVKYAVIKSTLFRYNYVMAEKNYMWHLVRFSREQGPFEHSKVEDLEDEEKLNHWTW